jgi:hypothetical protein
MVQRLHICTEISTVLHPESFRKPLQIGMNHIFLNDESLHHNEISHFEPYWSGPVPLCIR